MEAIATKPENVLSQRWDSLLADEPSLRIRNAAQRLGVSELALLLSRDEGVKSLKPEFGALMKQMNSVGEVMILTRNEQVVHEVTAAYKKFVVSGKGAMGLSVGDIDLRVFFNHWAYGYHVTQEIRGVVRESLQFFSAYGLALQKVYKTQATDTAAWNELVASYLDSSQPVPELTPAPAPRPRANAAEVDAEALKDSWANIKDVHHFHAMLQRNKVDRLTAVELVGPEWARPLKSSAEGILSPLDRILEQAQINGCPIMVFVGNPGLVQIFGGTINKLKRTGSWMNVLDPGFNLHANTDGITDWWVVVRPSTDGDITSIEGYNADGDIVITLFGNRKPGQPELAAWRREVGALEKVLCVSA
ncbi:MAG TPA: ChuX/HutX family heme-like substrate-binding protein [Marinobacter sp.]|nr:ChuX/HutX family heme-like substrate-binding protein [Marinobacter sp.]